MNRKIIISMMFLSVTLYASQLGDYFLEQLNNGSPIKLSIVKKIYNQEHKIKDKEDIFGSPLHQAVKFSNLEVVKFLISKGARVNEQSSFIGTPLHVAVAYGRVDVLKYLIRKGAKTRLKNGMGLTPLRIAKLYKYKKIYHYLEMLIAVSNNKKEFIKNKYLTSIRREKNLKKKLSKLSLVKKDEISVHSSYFLTLKQNLSYQEALMDLGIKKLQ